MSRIGRLPIAIPAGVTVTVDDNNLVSVKGPKGENSYRANAAMQVKVEDGHVTVKQERFYHTAYSEQSSASQGLIYKDKDDAIDTVTDIINKGQYKTMQAVALPQCEEWWEQTTSTLKARVQ